MQKHPNIRERLVEVDLDYQSGPQVQLMNFSQFIEGIVLHAQKAPVTTVLSRWELLYLSVCAILGNLEKDGKLQGRTKVDRARRIAY